MSDRCGAFGTLRNRCELPKGHPKEHREGRVGWAHDVLELYDRTAADLASVRAELEQALTRNAAHAVTLVDLRSDLASLKADLELRTKERDEARKTEALAWFEALNIPKDARDYYDGIAHSLSDAGRAGVIARSVLAAEVDHWIRQQGAMAVRVREGGAYENLAASFSVTAHKVSDARKATAAERNLAEDTANALRSELARERARAEAAERLIKATGDAARINVDTPQDLWTAIDELRARAEEAERYAEMVKAELLSEHAAGWQDRALDAERGRLEVAAALARTEEVVDQDAAKIAALRTALEEARNALEGVRGEFDSTVRHFANKGRGGQTVSLHGDFASVGPSAAGRMEWWSRNIFAPALASISRALGSTAGEGVAKP